MRAILMGAAIFLILCITVTFSYIWTGNKWDQNPTYYINEDLWTIICWGADGAVERAAETWSSVPGQTFGLNYAGYTDRNGTYYDEDGYNVVGYGSPREHPDNPGEAYPTTVGNTIVECDMILNDSRDWSAEFEDECPYWCFDVQTVALHEFGHWVGLDDVLDDPWVVMYKWIAEGEVKRVLSTDDENGIRSIYPADGGGDGDGCSGGKTPPTNAADPDPKEPHPPLGAGSSTGVAIELWEQLQAEICGDAVDCNSSRLSVIGSEEIRQAIANDGDLMAQSIGVFEHYKPDMERMLAGGQGRIIELDDIVYLDSWLAQLSERVSPRLALELEDIRMVLQTCEGVTARDLLSRCLASDQTAPEPGLGASPHVKLTVHPNPTSSSAAIRYFIPLHSDVKLAIYDAAGKKVAILAVGSFGPGFHTVTWDGGLPAGIYFLRLDACGQTLVRKLVVTR